MSVSVSLIFFHSLSTALDADIGGAGATVVANANDGVDDIAAAVVADDGGGGTITSVVE